MLYDFTYYNPTKIYFGKDAISNLSEELANYGKNILLLYGKNSIKKIGLYDEVIKILNSCGKNIVELAGIKPNPSYTQVLEGGRLVRDNKIDLILAVGGGSVIDCAKAISVSAYAKGDAWQRFWKLTIPMISPVLLYHFVTHLIGNLQAFNSSYSSSS